MTPEQQTLTITSATPYRVNDQNFYAVINQFKANSGLVIEDESFWEHPETVLDAFLTWHLYHYAKDPTAQIQIYRETFEEGIFDGYSKRPDGSNRLVYTMAIDLRVLDLMKFEIAQRDKK